MSDQPASLDRPGLIEDPLAAGTTQVRDSYRRAWQLALGLGWLALPAWLVSSLGDRTFLGVYAVLLVFVLGYSGLVAFWWAAWAARSDNRLGRFRIASLFLVMLLAAAFFG